MERTAKGFLDLAAETRLQIYGDIFSRRSGECAYGNEHQGHCCALGDAWKWCKDMYSGSATCLPVSTAILRVNKQIYQEASPVLLESIEVVVRMPNQFLQSDMNDMGLRLGLHDDAARNLRRMAIATSPADARVSVRGCPHPQPSCFEYMCQLISKLCPKLRDLRLHVDLHNGRFFTHRIGIIDRLGESLSPAVDCLDDVKVFIDVHGNVPGYEFHEDAKRHERAICALLRKRVEEAKKHIEVVTRKEEWLDK